MKRGQSCPVCGGNGKVMNGFYDQTGGQWTTSYTDLITCRSCTGKGYIIIEEEPITYG